MNWDVDYTVVLLINGEQNTACDLHIKKDRLGRVTYVDVAIPTCRLI